MEDLLPKEISDDLRKRFGDDFEEMSPEQRVVLCTAAVETTVSHARAMTLCDMHPIDMTRMLQGLVQKGCLAKVGQGRGSNYHLHGAPLVSPVDAFDPGPHPLPSDLARQPSDLVPQAPEVTRPPSLGRRILGLDLPFVDSLEDLDTISLARLATITERVSGGRVPKDLMVGAISELCEGRYVTLRVLAHLLDRSEDYLRQGYLNPLVRSGDLTLAFPQAPNDPRQAYTAIDPTSGR